MKYLTLLALIATISSSISVSAANKKNDANGNNPATSTLLIIYSANFDFYYKDTREYYAPFPDHYRYSPGEMMVKNQVGGGGKVLAPFTPIWASIHENGSTCHDQITALNPADRPRKMVLVTGDFRNCSTLPAGQRTGATVPCTWITSPVCETVEE